MMKSKKDAVDYSVISELLTQHREAADQASIRHNRDGSINYAYVSGVLTGSLNQMVQLACRGASQKEIQEALAYEITLINRI
jgi:hypothetical protein